MIGANVLWPWWARRGGPAVETIVPTLRFSGSKTGAAFALWDIANITANAGDLLMVNLVYNGADNAIVTGIDWLGGGAPVLGLRNGYNYQVSGDRAVECWTKIAAAGTHTIRITWSGAFVTKATAIIHSWAGFALPGPDKTAANGAPPAPTGAPGFSGFTPATAQAHELILGTMGYSIGQPLVSGGWVAPLVELWSENDGTGAGGNGLTVGWFPAHAIAAYEARDAGWSPPIVDWGVLCTTFAAV